MDRMMFESMSVDDINKFITWCEDNNVYVAWTTPRAILTINSVEIREDLDVYFRTLNELMWFPAPLPDKLLVHVFIAVDQTQSVERVKVLRPGDHGYHSLGDAVGSIARRLFFDVDKFVYIRSASNDDQSLLFKDICERIQLSLSILVWNYDGSDFYARGNYIKEKEGLEVFFKRFLSEKPRRDKYDAVTCMKRIIGV